MIIATYTHEEAIKRFGFINGTKLYYNYLLTMNNASDIHNKNIIIMYDTLMRHELNKNFLILKDLMGFNKECFSEANLRLFCYHFLVRRGTIKIHKMVYCRDEMQNPIFYTFNQYDIRDIVEIYKNIYVKN